MPVTPEFNQEQLQRIHDGIGMIWSALNEFNMAFRASERGGGTLEEKRGHEWLRRAFNNAPELGEVLPQLYADLTAGCNLADQGDHIEKEVDAARNRIDLPKSK